MQLSKRSKIILNWVVGPVLFVIIGISIYKQIKEQPNLSGAWETVKQSYHSWKLWAVLGLMLVNWGIEAKKWQILVYSVQRVGFVKAFMAILTGQALAQNTLNGVGEYVGRVIYLANGNRLRAVAVSMVGSMSQIIITMIMGILGLIYMRIYVLDATHHLEGLSVFWLNGIMYLLSVGTIIMILIYYKLSWLTQMFEKIPLVAKYSFYIQKLEELHWRELTRILLLSFLRYVVFIVQYILLLDVFGVQANVWSLAWIVCVMFLVLAIVPTIPIAELGVRGETSKQLFGLLSTNVLGIVFTAAGIWFINRAIPAIAGSLFILTVKLFRK